MHWLSKVTNPPKEKIYYVHLQQGKMTFHPYGFVETKRVFGFPSYEIATKFKDSYNNSTEQVYDYNDLDFPACTWYVYLPTPDGNYYADYIIKH